jgi:hypothetical protein
MSLVGISAFSGNVSLLVLIKESMGFKTSADALLSNSFSAEEVLKVPNSVEGFVSLTLMSGFFPYDYI